MKLIVGLGNPGREYELTRHNIGFMAIDELAKRWNISLNEQKFKELVEADERITSKLTQEEINECFN
ncbi:hypothetical protein ACT4UM_02150, partial [Bacillus sp. SS-TM]